MFENIASSILILPRNLVLQNSQWLAQILIEPPRRTPEEAALLFSGPKFFVALIAGVVLAFAFQFLLTNLSVAAGISYWGHQDLGHQDSEHQTDSTNRRSRRDRNPNSMQKITSKIGLWTLITVSIALFCACFLAVRLSLLLSPGLGAIVGLVIWGAYFSLLLWLSSTTVGSLIGSVVNTLTGGFQTMVNTATAALGGKLVSDRAVSTAAAAASTFRRELTADIDSQNLRGLVQDYLQRLRPPELDARSLRREFEDLLRDPEFQSVADSDRLQKINRQHFVDLIRSRSDLSPREVNRLADELDIAWRQATGKQKRQTDAMGQMREYLASAVPENLRSQELTTKLDQLITTLKKNPSNSSQQDGGLVNQAVNLATSTLMGAVLGRKDLSELDVEDIINKLRTVKDQVGGQIEEQIGAQTATLTSQTNGNGKTAQLPYSVIRSDIENYLLNGYSWQMNPEILRREFPDVIYDPDANPRIVRQQLESLNRKYFVDILSQRSLFPQSKIADLVNLLESIRLNAIAKTWQAEIHEQTEDVCRRVANYLINIPSTALLTENTQAEVAELFANPDGELEVSLLVLQRLDSNALARVLVQRQGRNWSEQEIQTLINLLSQGRDRAIAKVQERLANEVSLTNRLRSRIEYYLRNTNRSQLNSENFQRDLQTLIEDQEFGEVVRHYRINPLDSSLEISELRSIPKLGIIDRNSLVAALQERQDLKPEEIEPVLQQFEYSWNKTVLETAETSSLTVQVKDQYDSFLAHIADYLRNTNLEQLNPEGIQRDLAKLLENPKAGTLALRARLAQIDRETLLKLLGQRQDLSQEQIQQTLDQLQSGIRQIAKTPRRVAARTQIQIQDFQANLENYLRNTDKDELNPEAIKRDLHLLLHDPRVGLESISDRLAKFDRSTLVALLAQRPDISQEEAERIASDIEAARNQFVEQVRNVQRRIQSVLDNIFGRIRRYLNSLEREELNYDGIRQDIRRLFSDPQAGFEALRDRLSHFNRDTLVAILSSRDDISEADANRIIDQIETARNNVLQQAERLQQSALVKIEDVKRQAQKQAIETRKAAEIATWWLFGTALTSAIVSAVAGAIAVVV